MSKSIEKEVLTKKQKDYNQNIMYGNDVDVSTIISMAKQFPMGAERQVVIVKESQHLSRTIEQFEPYFLQPQPSTVLVINYKGKKVDKRTKFFNVIKKNSVFLDASKIYDNQLPQWIETTAKELGMNIDNKSKFLMAEFLGNDLGRVYNELMKLKVVVKNAEITPEIIEQNIGISKDFNNFELRKAIETKVADKACNITN